MASLEQQYAQAVSNLAKAPGADAGVIASKLEAHLKDTGRSKLAPRIAAELARLRAHAATTADTLEVATTEEAAAAKADAATLGVTAEPVVVPSLIRGWRITSNGELTDRSAKRTLVDLYRSITAR